VLCCIGYGHTQNSRAVNSRSRPEHDALGTVYGTDYSTTSQGHSVLISTLSVECLDVSDNLMFCGLRCKRISLNTSRLTVERIATLSLFLGRGSNA
jgi:hypothetical protein